MCVYLYHNVLYYMILHYALEPDGVVDLGPREAHVERERERVI